MRIFDVVVFVRKYVILPMEKLVVPMIVLHLTLLPTVTEPFDRETVWPGLLIVVSTLHAAAPAREDEPGGQGVHTIDPAGE